MRLKDCMVVITASFLTFTYLPSCLLASLIYHCTTQADLED